MGQTGDVSALFAGNSPSQPTFGQTVLTLAVKPAPKSRDTISQSSKKESSPVNRTVPRLTLDSFAGCTNPASLDTHKFSRFLCIFYVIHTKLVGIEIVTLEIIINSSL